ncbi:hypothetical protein AGOR_G00249210 [Albula goreensis]|uniref:Uncharacterized protein n=1 Tax=Albula goreensis TaxID=1534307 RepID=A0A8T3CHW8_9TELE|nr:hypothetical protein AGOR_G00249210 [Albula goreensis]
MAVLTETEVTITGIQSCQRFLGNQEEKESERYRLGFPATSLNFRPKAGRSQLGMWGMPMDLVHVSHQPPPPDSCFLPVPKVRPQTKPPRKAGWVTPFWVTTSSCPCRAVTANPQSCHGDPPPPPTNQLPGNCQAGRLQT